MFKIGNINIDALKNENINLSNEISSKAVEAGADITDNMKHNPVIISATCVMAGVDAINRYNALKQLALDDVLITYYGSLEPMKGNMAIESISNKRDYTYGNGFEFDITLKEILIAQIQTIQLAVFDKATSTKVESKTTNTGRKQQLSQTVNVASIKSKLMQQRLDMG
jgi:hypothetical protein